MKQRPSHQDLLEVLELCKVAEEKARILHEMGLEMTARWRGMREARLAAQQHDVSAKKLSTKAPVQ